LNYRADITGLRAVAVLAVLAFHSNFHAFSGGYVGVDIFFVISGFVISSTIFAQIESDKFRLVDFYERRIRRIIPAFAVMTLVVLLLSLVLLYPSEITDLAKSAIASSLSASNIFFWDSSGYFESPSMGKPLLHTWSLGVEEQFYLGFPLLVVTIGKVRKNLRPIIIGGLALISFGVSAYYVGHDPASAFYLPQSRVWELLIGALLAEEIVPLPKPRLAREIIAGAGILAIAAAIKLYDPSTPFPGVAALLPCIGVAAVIMVGSAGETLTGRFLRFPPLVFIGLISYSLYLWHWPIIVYQRIGRIVDTGGPAIIDNALAVLLAFPIAYLSWRFIEQPFRRVNREARVAPVLGPLAASALVCAIGVGIVATRGLPERFSPHAIQLADYLDYDPADDMRMGVCFLYGKFQFTDFDRDVCMHRVNGHAAYMLVGDSHAGDLYPGLEAVYGEDADILQATAAGCKPLLRDAGSATPCSRMAQFIYDDYLRQNHVDLLIISAQWSAEDIDGIARTLDWLRQRRIKAVLFGPAPEYNMRLPGLLARSANQGDFADVQSHLVREYGLLDREFRQTFVARPDAFYVSPYEALCKNDHCAMFAGDTPLFWDQSHLTRAGSIMLIERLREAIPLP
jgi:peptidoglycan/LPS O-acetylase OafA/YrhL